MMKVIISGKRIATAVLTLVLIFGVAVLPAKAATTKVKNQDFTLTKSKIKKPTVHGHRDMLLSVGRMPTK